jgi:hypothetical protein
MRVHTHKRWEGGKKRISETKTWVFEKIIRIDKPLANVI